MSGMAGNVSAFATVWTYDVYKPLLNKSASDRHYVSMGRWCSIVGVLIAILTAYGAMLFSNILVYLQVLVMFFIVPLFGTVILGMLWKRASPAGGFWGFLIGILSSISMFVWVHWFPDRFDATQLNPEHVKHIALSPLAKDMAVNMYGGLWSLLICMGVTILVSFCTRPKPANELKDLVYGLTARPDEGPCAWYRRPILWASVVALALLAVNIIFW
jgi:SSS family solute:Na+ symporter